MAPKFFETPLFTEVINRRLKGKFYDLCTQSKEMIFGLKSETGKSSESFSEYSMELLGELMKLHVIGQIQSFYISNDDKVGPKQIVVRTIVEFIDPEDMPSDTTAPQANVISSEEEANFNIKERGCNSNRIFEPDRVRFLVPAQYEAAEVTGRIKPVSPVQR